MSSTASCSSCSLSPSSILNQIWPSLKTGTNVQFWRNRWFKHGEKSEVELLEMVNLEVELLELVNLAAGIGRHDEVLAAAQIRTFPSYCISGTIKPAPAYTLKLFIP